MPYYKRLIDPMGVVSERLCRALWTSAQCPPAAWPRPARLGGPCHRDRRDGVTSRTVSPCRAGHRSSVTISKDELVSDCDAPQWAWSQNGAWRAVVRDRSEQRAGARL